MDSALANFLSPTPSGGVPEAPREMAGEKLVNEPLTIQVYRHQEELQAMRQRLSSLENALRELVKLLSQQVGLNL